VTAARARAVAAGRIAQQAAGIQQSWPSRPPRATPRHPNRSQSPAVRLRP
jgi:hypothetical protein